MILTRHPGQRDINKRKVRRLTLAVLHGKLTHFEIECDAQGRVVNGQHRMLATSYAGLAPKESAAMITLRVAPRTIGYALRLLLCTLRAWWRS